MKKHVFLCLIGLLAAVPLHAQGSPLDVVEVPEGLVATVLSGPDLTPCVACLCAVPTGEVYAGVDQIGSLGKGEGKGKILRLVDVDGDGAAESHTVYATVDNPRGLFAVGDRLFVLHSHWRGRTFAGTHLSVCTDADGDGAADGAPVRLVSGLSSPRHNQSRGVDHATNGIRLGIDGWIYIAVGDFGIAAATGSDGRTLTMHGGGIVRVRPDGSELEIYTHGLRNIYDVAIDPLMNLFTRGNTNDGGGWNVRFAHQVQSGEYGYPTLFKRYTHEILPALADLGGGSGTGAIFFDEPGWPEGYTGVPLMCDWGRGALFIHRVTADGPGFIQAEESFLQCSRITDVDCDGSGRLYLGSWHGSGYKGGNGGFVIRVTPENWQLRPFPDLRKEADDTLAAHLAAPSATLRLHAQQELLRRGPSAARVHEVRELALSPSSSIAARVAAIYTLKQLSARGSHVALLDLVADRAVQEHALRALADRTTERDGVPLAPFIAGLASDDARVRVAAAIGLGRLGHEDAAGALLAVAVPPEQEALPEPTPPTRSGSSLLFRSAVVEHTETTTIDVDVSGCERLVLAIGDGGDGSGHDHGSWYEPTLVTASGDRIELTDLEWASAQGGWGKTLVNQGCTGGKLARKDRQPAGFGIGSHAPSLIVYENLPEDAVRFQAVGGINVSSKAGSVDFMVAAAVDAIPGSEPAPIGPHATPNPAAVLPHVAVKALVALDAARACLGAIGGEHEAGALRALREMHTPEAVAGLIAHLASATEAPRRYRIMSALVRLANREKPYDGSTWWSTRPDTRGPYYTPTPWAETPKIHAALQAAAARDPAARSMIEALARRDRVELDWLTSTASIPPEGPAEAPPVLNVAAIAARKGPVASMAIDEVLKALGTLRGEPSRGRRLFASQACTLCHSLDPGEQPKGPFMGQIGAIMDRNQIARSILRPEEEISQGFRTVSIRTRQDVAYLGFVSSRSSERIVLRDIAGTVVEIAATDVVSEQEIEMTMMPQGLANGLSLEDFAALVDFLAAQK